MTEKMPANTLTIKTDNIGLYRGFNKTVALGSKLLIACLVIWAAIFPAQANTVLDSLMNSMSRGFGAWYMYVMAFYALIGVLIACTPRVGSIRLGGVGEQPEYSRFSWYAMMFGAGIGFGMLTFATAEPINHFITNPDTIMGHMGSGAAENLPQA